MNTTARGSLFASLPPSTRALIIHKVISLDAQLLLAAQSLDARQLASSSIEKSSRRRQSDQVYDWQEAQTWFCLAHDPRLKSSSPLLRQAPLAVSACRALATRVLRDHLCFGIQVVPLEYPSASANGSYSSITLPLEYRTKPVILHECAHVICQHWGIHDGHGPRFLRVYVALLARYLHLPSKDLLVSTRQSGLPLVTRIAPRHSLLSAYSDIEATQPTSPSVAELFALSARRLNAA